MNAACKLCRKFLLSNPDGRTENGYTPEQERQLIREAKYAEKYGKRYHSVREAMNDILGEK